MKKKKNSGFSLIELMVVVGIIGILASMAIPRFQEFQAKARQSEAKTNLNYIATLQEAYFDDPVSGNSYFGGVTVNGDTCNTAAALGFSPSPCNKLAYSYEITAGMAPAPTHNTVATEFNNLVYMCSTGTDATGDQWRIDQSRNLTHPRSGMSC